jgi:Endopolygalacturonase
MKNIVLGIIGIGFSIISLTAGNIRVHPVPKQILYNMHNDDFTVQVRSHGGDEWLDLYEYKVGVDMDTKSEASLVQFDFEGKADIRVKVNNGMIHDVKIRPLKHEIACRTDGNVIFFSLDKPAKLSLEINGNRLNNLHIIANATETEIPSPDDPDVIWFGEGVHRPNDLPGNSFTIPSNKTVYLAPGAVIQGKFICNKVENVRFIGRGIILNGQRGFEVTHSKNIEIDGITVINPDHYTVYGGETDGLTIRNLNSFSNKGWSDGIDLMSCSNVLIDNVFMRNSDDCIALYAHRWNFYGDVRNVTVRNSVLWADIAHPINIGGHGNYKREPGDTFENITFRNIDILEHDEDDRNYQGCMTIDVGDRNLVKKVLFEDIRVENIQEGRLFTMKVRFNDKYDHQPGRGIEDVVFRNITYNGFGENPSVIQGYDPQRSIKGITFENIIITGKKAGSIKDLNVTPGEYVENVVVR